MLGQTAPLPHVDAVIDQRVYLPERCRGRVVLHLGCVDEGLTQERQGSGLLLHEELSRTAGELIGVDLSEDGIEVLRKAIPGRYIAGNIEEMDDLDLPAAELVVAAEVIEHLPSPGRFLDGLQRYLERTGATAIITTPCAYSWRALVTLVVQRRDRVHPDHLLVYTPVTFQRAMQQAGLRVIGYRVHVGSKRERSRLGRIAALADRVIVRINPFLAVGLVVEVEPMTRAR